MTVFNADPLFRINNTERSARLSWELGAGEDFDGEPCTAVAQLSVIHDKDRKRFIASVQRIDVSKGRHGPIEKFAPFSGTRVQLPSQPIARYSKRAFEEAIEAALTELRSRIDEPAVVAVADPTSPA